MRVRTTLIMLGVLAALSAYMYFGELRQPQSQDTGGTPTPGPLWTLSVDQVVGLTVRGEGNETRLSRAAGGEWALEAPEATAADAGRVTQLLGRLAEVAPTRTLSDTTGPLADFGLDQPSLEVTLRLAAGQTQVLRIGAATPQQTDYYAQVQGLPGIHLLSDSLVASLRNLLEQPPVQPTPTPTEPATAPPSAGPTGAPAATPSG